MGLDICADIIVGNEMRRGISGGQRKRVTTGMFLHVNHFDGSQVTLVWKRLPSGRVLKP